MKMQKRQFRIGELARRLAVEKFVIRFWEKEFGLASPRSNGGQRFYTEEDFNRFKEIKSLLYDQGFTISGAQKKLSTPHPEEDTMRMLGSHKTSMDEQLSKNILSLQEQLIKLRDLL